MRAPATLGRNERLARPSRVGVGLLLSMWLLPAAAAIAQPAPTATATATAPSPSRPSNRDAAAMLDRVLRQLVFGAPFDAKLRQRVWTSGREVIGVGSYEHAGDGTGRFNLQLTMHDGDGKHTLQQISDGKLAWTRQVVAGRTTLKRVNLGALDELTRLDESTRIAAPHRDRRGTDPRVWNELVSGRDGSRDPNGRDDHETGRDGRAIDERLLVGGFPELIRQAVRDYKLRLSGGRLEGEPVWIVAGPLCDRARTRILEETGRSEWPDLLPDHIRIAITADPEHKSGLGAGVPVRFEFWRGQADQMISLIELYAIRPIDPPPAARFKFVSEESGVQFVDDTDRYRELAGRDVESGDDVPETE